MAERPQTPAGMEPTLRPASAAEVPTLRPASTPAVTPPSGTEETLRYASGQKPAFIPPTSFQVPGYDIIKELGRGGMGVVYLARQQELKRNVALKMILSGAHAGEDELRRFRAEAEAVARLAHPCIVQIYDIGEHDGRPFCALEFCGGGSLAQKVTDEKLSPQQTAGIMEKLARAMHAAHMKGIIHRDLKPANVLLDDHGEPKITDFGLAKKLDEPGLTHSGAVMGTPSYMSPEQASGHTAEIGPPTDIYALGAMMYELLTGRPPFKGNTSLATIHQVLDQAPEPPRRLNKSIDTALEAICLKCLGKGIADRYATALALAEDLAAYLRGDTVQAERSQQNAFLKLLVKESRHAEVLALWGRSMITHAVEIFIFALLTDVLMIELGQTRPEILIPFWLCGIGVMAVTVYFTRFRGGIPLTTIEVQANRIWMLCSAAVIFSAVILWHADLEPMKILPVALVIISFTLGALGVIYNGTFYLLMVASAAHAAAMAFLPMQRPALYGTTFSIALAYSGWRCLKYETKPDGSKSESISTKR
jgi:eukaryotic-like serine/threonine-protein kinase